MKVTMTTSNANVRPKVLYREALTDKEERIELTVFQRSPGAWKLLTNAPLDAVLEIDGYFGEIKNPAYPRNYIVNTAVRADAVAVVSSAAECYNCEFGRDASYLCEQCK
jgi:hypothetical protein